MSVAASGLEAFRSQLKKLSSDLRAAPEAEQEENVRLLAGLFERDLRHNSLSIVTSLDTEIDEPLVFLIGQIHGDYVFKSMIVWKLLIGLSKLDAGVKILVRFHSQQKLPPLRLGLGYQGKYMKGSELATFRAGLRSTILALHRGGIPVSALLSLSNQDDKALHEKCLEDVQGKEPNVQALYPDLADPDVLASVRMPPAEKLAAILKAKIDWQHDTLDEPEPPSPSVEPAIQAIPNNCLMTIFLLGRSGVGKSTLYNKFLGLNSPSDVGYSSSAVGRPVTSGVQLSSGSLLIDRSGSNYVEPAPYHFETEKAVLLADCEGIEGTGKSGERIANAWFNLLECIRLAKNPLLWYCISDPRLLDDEIENIALISQKLPVMLVNVRGKSSSAETFKAWLAQEQGLPENVRRNFVSVNALPLVTLADGTVSTLESGMDELISLTVANWDRAILLHESMQATPRDRCYWWISIAVAGATATGASPIPIADFTMLFPIQVSMLLAIATELQIPVTKALLSALVFEVIAASGGRFAGRFLLAEGMKLIPLPGWGSVASGVLSGAFTASLGLAFYSTLVSFKATTQDYQNMELADSEVWQRILQNTKDKWGSNYDRGLEDMNKELKSKAS